MDIRNGAGEVVISGLRSDAEACRVWHEQGRRGDYLADTGEIMETLSEMLFPHIKITFDRNDCVQATVRAS